MPIDPRRYPRDWQKISDRVRFEREQGRCQHCGGRHGELHKKFYKTIFLECAHVGIAKEDGTPGDKNDRMDCRDENLLALCQWCHLAFDDYHVEWRDKLRRDRQREAGQMELPIIVSLIS